MRSMADAAPWLDDRRDALTSWDEVKLLDVRLDRLSTWYVDGLLCLGDAAHAMSPVGGVGINLAIQDAVAARILAAPLLSGTTTTRDLARVQRRRAIPAAVIQAVQRVLHARLIAPALTGRVEIAGAPSAPRTMRLLRRTPLVRGIPPYLLGRGVLPEHAPDFARRPPPPPPDRGHRAPDIPRAHRPTPRRTHTTIRAAPEPVGENAVNGSHMKAGTRQKWI